MATPAVIIVEGAEDIELYKHSDGSPDSTLAWLEEFNKNWSQCQSYDNPNYLLAQLMRDTVFSQEKYNLTKTKDLGWGIYLKNDMWGDYIYTLKLDGTVTVEKGEE